MYLAGVHTSSGLKYSKVNLFDRLIQPPALPALPCLHPFIQHIVFISDTELGAGDTEMSIFSLTGYVGWSHQWLNSDVYRHGCSETHLLSGPIQGLGKYIRGGHQRLLFLQSSLGVNRWYGVSRAMRHSRISANTLLSLPTTTQPNEQQKVWPTFPILLSFIF